MADITKAEHATDENTDVREMGELPEESYPCLRVVAGPGRGAVYPLQEGVNQLGRSDMCHLLLDDSSISREHCQLEVRADGALVRDLGSRNGTQIQGVPIQAETPITHGQRLKVGAYDFQYLTGPADLPAEDSEPEQSSDIAQTIVDTGAEAMEPMPSEPVPAAEQAPETPVAEAPEGPPPAEIPEQPAADLPAEVPPAEAPMENPESAPLTPEASPGKLARLLAPLRRIPKWLSGVSLGLLVIGFVAWLAYSFWFSGGPPTPPPELPTGTGSPVDPQAVSGTVKMTVPEYVPVFLDFSASPIGAEVFFGKEKVGNTPFRMSAHLQFEKIYEVKGTFALDEIGETVEKKLRFSLGSNQQVIPLKFEAEIGPMKIKALPRNVDLYLEAYFARDPHRAKPIKFSEVVFGKPIYLPYGRYMMELRQNRQLSASQTFVNEVVYRREFKINAEQNSFEIDVQDKDLKIFPAKLRSIPAGAEVLLDGELIGTTPLSQDIATGEHELILRKEGYFEHKQAMRVDMNTPFEVTVQLKTSEAGHLINEARLRIKQRRYQEAINTLINSLKLDPTKQEIAEAHYLIGQSYLYLRSFGEARDYYTQAMRHEAFRYAARLGVAQIHYAKNEKVQALQILTEVLIAAKRDEIKSEAGRLFQQISPFRSVLYITSDPPGATVVINDRAVAVKTPLLLHDLMVGKYRIQLHLPGFKNQQVKVDLGISEFKPMVIKLEPVDLVR